MIFGRNRNEKARYFGISAGNPYGCGRTGRLRTGSRFGKKEPVTLKVWESDGVEKQFIEEMAKSYMDENPHVTIIVEPVAHTDAAQRLQLDGPAGVGPMCLRHPMTNWEK